MDRSSTSKAIGAGLILISLEGAVIEYTLHFTFLASNNEAKYEVLIVGLKLALELRTQWQPIFIDSQLVVNQV